MIGAATYHRRNGGCLQPLYRRHGRVVPNIELTRAARISRYSLREQIGRFRKRLFGSRFRLVTYRAEGYELVVQGD